jgi:hypothetical protein
MSIGQRNKRNWEGIRGEEGMTFRYERNEFGEG